MLPFSHAEPEEAFDFFINFFGMKTFSLHSRIETRIEIIGALLLRLTISRSFLIENENRKRVMKKWFLRIQLAFYCF